MPKIRLISSRDEWTYEQSAHRQVCSNDFFVKETIHSKWCVAFWYLSLGSNPCHFPNSCNTTRVAELFSFQGSDSDPRRFWLMPWKIVGEMFSSSTPISLLNPAPPYNETPSSSKTLAWRDGQSFLE